MPAPIDITGQTFGLLEVLKLSNKMYKNHHLWECRCNACGCTTYEIGYNLRSGKRKSCGCAKGRAMLRGEELREPQYDCALYNEKDYCDGLTEMMCVTRGYCKFYKPRED